MKGGDFVGWRIAQPFFLFQNEKESIRILPDLVGDVEEFFASGFDRGR
jgi:hypothetical protein